MSKILAETKGQYQIADLIHDQIVRHEGYSVVKQSPYLAKRIGVGHVGIIAEVSDEATDADWLDTVKECDGDLDMAVEAFKSEFPAGKPRAAKQSKADRDKAKADAEAKAKEEAEAKAKAEAEAKAKETAAAAKK